MTSAFDSTAAITFGAAALGALMQEVIYWYNLRHKLEEKKYSALANSRAYWIIMVVTVLGAGLTSLIWFFGRSWPHPKDAFVFGIGLPLLIKQLGSINNRRVKFGSRSRQSPLSMYLDGT